MSDASLHLWLRTMWNRQTKQPNHYWWSRTQAIAPKCGQSELFNEMAELHCITKDTLYNELCMDGELLQKLMWCWLSWRLWYRMDRPTCTCILPRTSHHIHVVHVCSILCYLRNSRKPVDFFHDKQFTEFRKALNTEIKHLKSASIHSKAHKAKPLATKDDKNLRARWPYPKGLAKHHLFFRICPQEWRRVLPIALQTLSNQGHWEAQRVGGLKARKISKDVVQYTCISKDPNPARCPVMLWKL